MRGSQGRAGTNVDYILNTLAHLSAIGIHDAELEWLAAEVRPAAHAFYIVAFHPDLPEDLADPHRAVGFIRRSPDPTLQLVRSAVLDRVRGEHTGGSVFVDTSKLTAAELLALDTPEPLSDKIAKANLETVRREGPVVLRALLARLRGGGQG